jgi:hypothetical protein
LKANANVGTLRTRSRLIDVREFTLTVKPCCLYENMKAAATDLSGDLNGTGDGV